MSGARRWLIPSYGTILALAALTNALVLRGAGMFARDGDGARHVRLGREILSRGGIPATDSFSHTREGAPIVLHEWLSETILAWADLAGGLPAVAVLAAGLFTIAVFGVYRSADELGAPRPLALAVGVVALLLQSIHLLPRPHLFSTALGAVFMVVLLRFASSGRSWALAPLPVLMLVWANLHGGFLLGCVLVAAFLVGAVLGSREFAAGTRSAKPLALTLLACLAATFVTPAGVELWTYTLGHLGTDDFLLAATEEFQSVDFHAGYGRFFFVVLFAGPVLWMTGRVRVSWLGAGLYLFFAASALYAARNIPLFTIAALPWLAVWTRDALEGDSGTAGRALSRLRHMDAGDRTLQPWAWTLVGAALVAWALGPGARLYRFDPHAFPAGALEDIQPSGWGPVFNQMHWGGYLLYVRPDIPVFIDGQTDFYGEELAREYLAALEGRPGWRAVLDEHRVGWTLTATHAPLVQLLHLDRGWSHVYTDGVATIFRRRGAEP